MGTDVRLPDSRMGTQYELLMEQNSMDIRQGEHILVNLAPFIGSSRPSSQSIPCDVLAIDESRVEVRTLEPYRKLSLWVSSAWIDSKLESAERQLTAV